MLAISEGLYGQRHICGIDVSGRRIASKIKDALTRTEHVPDDKSRAIANSVVSPPIQAALTIETFTKP